MPVRMSMSRVCNMKREELIDGMKVIDTDDGMILEYKKEGKSDFFVTDNNKWHTCQFDLDTFEALDSKNDK